MKTFLFLPLFFLSAALSFGITENQPPLQVYVNEMTPLRCVGGAGVVRASVSGGQAPYTFIWSTGQQLTTNNLYMDINAPTPMAYGVAVYDALGASDSSGINIYMQPFFSNDVFHSLISECNWQSNSTVQFYINTTGSWANLYIDHGFGSGFIPYNTFLGVACYLPGSNNSVTIREGGCDFIYNFSTPALSQKSVYYTTQGSCLNIPSGSVTVNNISGFLYNFAFPLSVPDLVLTNPSGSIQRIIPINYNFPLTFSNLPAGNNYAIVYKTYSGNSPNCFSTCPDTLVSNIVVPQLPDSCGVISGNVYLDQNLNCVLDGSEYSVPNAIVSFSPSGRTVSTNASGFYKTALPFGNHSASWSTPFNSANTCAVPVNFNLSPVILNATRDLSDTISTVHDKRITIAGGIHRVGYNTSYSIHIQNLTANPVSGNVIDFYYDPILTFTSSNFSTSINQTGHLQWTGSSLNLQAYQTKWINVTLNIPPNPALAGTIINTNATINAAGNEINLNDNTAVYSSTIITSFDPNEKRVLPKGIGPQGFISPSENILQYVIDFQNTGNDTAIHVMILDTLSPFIDPLTFIAGPSSHLYRYTMSETGQVRFHFSDIYLPDSTTNEPKSHGFVSYSVRLKPNLPPGTEIRNTAYNYFDFNLPVATNTVINTIDLTTSLTTGSNFSEFSVYPNPGNKIIHIRSAERIEMHQITLIDISGKILLQKFINSNDRFSTDLNVEAIRAGIYFILIDSKGGRRSMKFSKLKD